MKGKYGKRSSNRRDREELQAEASAAKIAADRAERQRAKVTVESTKRVEVLEQELTTLRRHVVEQTSAEVLRLRAKLEEQRREISRLQSDMERLITLRHKSANRLIIALSEMFQVTVQEAGDIVYMSWYEEDPDDRKLVEIGMFDRKDGIVRNKRATQDRAIGAAAKGLIRRDQASAIQRARGDRAGSSFAGFAREVADEVMPS